MTTARVAVGLILILLLGVPLLLPLVEALSRPDAWRVWGETERVRQLARNTALLVGGTLLVSLPLGTLAAFLFYRSNLPFARFWRSLTLFTLFVPLPLFASAWQATLGTGGWLPAAVWRSGPFTEAVPGDVRPVWKPWAQGFGAAIWVHSVAALPWVILIVGHGLRWVERELEEDALTVTSSRGVLFHVTLPRSRAALAVAGLWVALLTATEITVADMMQIRTAAEEVYLQFNLFDDAGLARTVHLMIPAVVGAVALLIVFLRRFERTVPPLERLAHEPRVYSLGAWRWPWLIVVMAAAAMLTLVPVGSLVWKAGLSGNPESWSSGVALSHLENTARAGGVNIASSIAVAAAAGAIAAVLGLVVCWLGQDSAVLRGTTVVLMAIAWVLPAPVVGIGLKEAIHLILDLEEGIVGGWLSDSFRPARALLYDGPSGVPIAWAYLVRFFPFAVAIQWTVVRQIPRELRDAIRIDSASAWQEFWHLIAPLSWPICVQAGFAVTVLGLGEIGASKLVWAGWHPFAHEVFAQMHYGVTNDLAAMCLVLLLLAGSARIPFVRSRWRSAQKGNGS